MDCSPFLMDVLLLLPVLLTLGAFYYYVIVRPLNRVRDLDDVVSGGKSRRRMANRARRMKKVGQVPPLYPNGWFAVCESDHLLPAGSVRSINALGEHLVAFRTEAGEACVLDAYCPHLGAHLGVGGRVVGDCIECPFHGWQFDGRDGLCSSIPYSNGKVPSTAHVKKWITEEINGFVFIWYHAEGSEPHWQVPVIGDLASWVYHGRTDYKVNCHIQEIPENGADVAHLAMLHGPSMLGIGSSWFSHHHWTVSWTGPEADQPDQHVAVSKIQHEFRLMNRLSILQTQVEAEQIGPGLVHLWMDTYFGRLVIVQTVTPIGPLLQSVVHRIYTCSSVPSLYAKLVLWGEAVMFERDVLMWNHKTYISRPLLVSEDRAIVRHRRWYQQFYSEHSPQLLKLHQDNDSDNKHQW